MRYDLLYLTPEDKPDTSENVIYDLSLDRVFEYVEPDVSKRREFLKRLSAPPRLRENIEERQLALRDFISNPTFLGELVAAVRTYAEAHDDFSRRRGKLVSDSRIGDGPARASLIITSSHLYEQLKHIKNISAVLRRYKLHSRLLGRLCCRLYALIEENAETFNELSELLGKLRNVTSEDTFTVTAHLSDDCRLSGCVLSTVDEYKSSHGIMKLFNGRTKALKDKLMPESGNKYAIENSDGLRNSLLGEGLRETMSLITAMISGLYGELEALQSGLEFYSIALEYYRLMRRKDMPAVFPEITDTPALDCRGLYDLLLSFEQPNASGVVPNDVLLAPDTDGVIIRGENNSGKTVFLRSAGSAALLAQNGLPIPCGAVGEDENARAVCGIFGGIHTQFAAAEKEFEAGNDAGRFEQEVRELAAVIENAKSNSLVLLNESFQTTAYTEGAEGMYHILRYLTANGIKWVIVTHLPELSGHFEGGSERIVRMRTSEGYRLTEAEKL